MKQRDIIKPGQQGQYPLEKVLLILLPYWTPQIPPLGISCLKSFLQPRGYEVKTADANVDEKARKIYNDYFDILRGYVSENKRGNFYNIGHEVLQNHLMAHLHTENEKEYIAIIKTLVKRTFFLDIDDQQVARLNHIVRTFYEWLETYILDLLDTYQPSVLGLSVYKGSLPASMFAFKLTREKYPSIKTVMGGAVFSQTLGYGTPNFERFLEKTKDYLDYIIIGEGERLFLELLEGKLPTGQRVYTLADVGHETLDLSKMEIPDFSDLNIRFYPNLSAYSSRSCPFNCSFCTETVYWGKFRKKKGKQVMEELSKLYKRHNFQLFLLCDSLLNPIVTDLARESINSGISIYWDGYLRVDPHVCDPDTTFFWRQGGFYRARLGVESGSQRILDAMKKNITIDKIKSALSSLADSGIKTTTYWIIGYPGETEEDFQKTLDLIEELKDDIYEAECNPFGYYLTGQVDSGEWLEKYKQLPLYPEETAESLVTQSWVLDCEPSREETYQRISQFVEHCRRLGIANPYSLYDIYQADDRWKKLHKHAVPSIIEFKNRDVSIDESKHLKKLSFISTTLDDERGFDF